MQRRQLDIWSVNNCKYDRRSLVLILTMKLLEMASETIYQNNTKHISNYANK